jgi:drug/metabolite transporter (DMT)-like permease
MTALSRIFLAYAAAVGAASGIVLVTVPQAAETSVRPYFWILIALLLFDAAAFLRRRGEPGTMITMGTRLAGFLVAVVLMVAITMLAGTQVRFF